jgi:predicted MFS family arabinose efflux permease
MTLFPIPVITVFWTEQIGLSLRQVMLLQVVFAATSVLFEFPSGYVADRIGYRRALVVGAALWIAGWLAYALGTTFLGMALAEVLLGAGLAFASGADSALLFVSLERGGRVVEYASWEGRVRAAGQLAEAASSAIGGPLYALAPRLPIWLQVPAAAALLGTSAALSDEARSGAGSRVEHWRRALGVVRHSFLGHRRLRTAMGLSVALGISSFVMVWLIQPWMLDRGIPTAWFGPLWAAAHLWLAAVSLASARVVARLGARPTLLACCALVGIGYAVLATATSPVGVVGYLAFMTLRGLQGPVLAAVMQADAPSEDRASVLSLNALLFRLAVVVLFPLVGALVDDAGMGAALAVLGVLCTAASLLAWIAFARAHRGAS